MCDIFIGAFQAAMDIEANQRPVTAEFRLLSSAMGSPFSYVRLDAVRTALQLLIDKGMACGTSCDGALYDVVGKAYGMQQQGSSNEAAWDQTQQALRTNMVAGVFHRIFPRRDLQFHVGPLQTPQLSREAALRWTTLTSAQQLMQMYPNADSASTTVARAPALGFFDTLRAVTFAEQELALRFLQGLCLVVPSQKELVSESPLLYLFAETMQCLKQHVDAKQDISADAEARVVAIPGSRENSPLRSTTNSAVSPAPDPFSVSLDPQLEAVVAAMVDAVEAACHYHPRTLVGLVSSGALRAALHMALSKHSPKDLRCSVLDFVSVILQQVLPFRRLAADAGDAADGPSDSLSAMMRAARGDSGNAYYGPSHGTEQPGGSSGAGLTALFYMDRASASKLESTIRDILSQRQLTAILPQLIQLRDVRGTGLSLSLPRPEAQRLLHKAYRLREVKLAELLKNIDENQ